MRGGHHGTGFWSDDFGSAKEGRSWWSTCERTEVKLRIKQMNENTFLNVLTLVDLDVATKSSSFLQQNSCVISIWMICSIFFLRNRLMMIHLMGYLYNKQHICQQSDLCWLMSSSCESRGLSSAQWGRMYPMGPDVLSKRKWKPLEWISGQSVTLNTDLKPMPFCPGQWRSRQCS